MGDTTSDDTCQGGAVCLERRRAECLAGAFARLLRFADGDLPAIGRGPEGRAGEREAPDDSEPGCHGERRFPHAEVRDQSRAQGRYRPLRPRVPDTELALVYDPTHRSHLAQAFVSLTEDILLQPRGPRRRA